MKQPEEEVYHLKMWGGIENDGYLTKKIGTEQRDFWFESKEERDKFRSVIQGIANRAERYDHSTVVFKETDGIEGLYKTIACMDLVYKGVVYYYEEDFGYGYSPSAAKFMFMYGNYSCDCNLSLFLKRKGVDIEELGCGHEIEVCNFDIKLVHYEEDV